VKDNPQLTVRLVKGKNPLRIVADSKLRIPLRARILRDLENAPTIIAATAQADSEKSFALNVMGIEVLTIKKDKDDMVDLRDLLQELGRRNISSVLVEGGATTITSFIRQRLADKIIVIIAPKLLGRGVEAVGDLGIREVKKALKLSLERVYKKGEDLIIEASI
jgi:riboflavin-specific deaminase-like protein